jgi:hypothetical protein
MAEPSRLIHERLEREREKQQRHRIERSESGSKGAKSRWNKGDRENGSAIKEPMAKNGFPVPSFHSPVCTSPDTSFVQPAAELADRLRILILANNGNARITEGQVKNWAKHAELMLRIDHRSVADAMALLEWSQKDPFWSSNVLSMETFRKQYDKLTMKQKQGGNGIHGNESRLQTVIRELDEQAFGKLPQTGR